MQNIRAISHLIINTWLSYKVSVNEVTDNNFKYFSKENFLPKAPK